MPANPSRVQSNYTPFTNHYKVYEEGIGTMAIGQFNANCTRKWLINSDFVLFHSIYLFSSLLRLSGRGKDEIKAKEGNWKAAGNLQNSESKVGELYFCYELNIYIAEFQFADIDFWL